MTEIKLIEEEEIKPVNVEKDITGKIINESDKSAVRAVVTNIDTEDNTITVDLFDADEKPVARKRVYEVSTAPFSELTEAELVAVTGTPLEEGEPAFDKLEA